MSIEFRIEATDQSSSARVSFLKTARVTVETPIFMPVATNGALRGVDLTFAATLGYQVLLANTYHLMLRPGVEVLRQYGGLTNFSRWDGAFLTDSGGYQLFSLNHQVRIKEEGAIFRSYVDGEKILLTPERSIEIQEVIGSDIMMVLDHCISSTASYEDSRNALQLTSRWAKRCLNAKKNSAQALFGIVQGGSVEELRTESAEQVTCLPFDGFALGGLAVGEQREVRDSIVEFSAKLLPTEKPRYLMGVGTPLDILEAVKSGIDMFDCILPTSLAHQGVCFTAKGKIDLRRSIYRNQNRNLDDSCDCSTCRRYSVGYLHHLTKAREFIVGHLLSIHNLTFFFRFLAEIRRSIRAGVFFEFHSKWRDILIRSTDEMH